VTTRGRHYENEPPEAPAGAVLHRILNSGPSPGPPYTHTLAAPGPVTLTSADPEPPAATIVRDSCGGDWCRYGGDEGGYEGGYWVCEDSPDSDPADPESWPKIAGNYGPVTLLEWGGEDEDSPLRPAPSYTMSTGEILPPSEPVVITGEFCPECEREGEGFIARPHDHEDDGNPVWPAGEKENHGFR
jgi:hypothetical protein